MTRAYYADRTLVTCPHCQRTMPARGAKNHANACICEPARHAAILAALEDPARPGFGLSRDKYNVIAKQRGLLQAQSLGEQVADHVGKWPHWNEVLKFFGFSYKRQVDDEAATTAAIAQAAAAQAAARQAEDYERVGERGLPVLRWWETPRGEVVYVLR